MDLPLAWNAGSSKSVDFPLLGLANENGTTKGEDRALVSCST